ncbi:hypothetical protein BHE19_08610 [Flavobacterium tructae]|uniref:Uncharacterized protein n=1 Tax=Flavobacterium tructae TaxID=1114873 RepID=A0A1S1J5C8_9FLAO|nr:hypothetical protein BHE19_08610 [Flavobacterium tructae]
MDTVSVEVIELLIILLIMVINANPDNPETIASKEYPIKGLKGMSLKSLISDILFFIAIF